MPKALAIAATLALFPAGCRGEPPTRETPEGAFARLGACVDRADRACLYVELDRDSRWSVQSIFRTLAETRDLADRAYPPERRLEAFGSLIEESRAADPAELFAAFCVKRSCLAELARGFGAVVEVSDRSGGECVVTTTRDASFPMAAPDGEWGLASFREDLARAKIRSADNLAQVRQNAAAFEEQRLAVDGEPERTGG